MQTELTLVVNRLGRPLSPTRRTDMIRKKIKRGLARHIGWLHNGIRIVQLTVSSLRLMTCYIENLLR